MANFASMTASLNLNFSNFTSGLRSAAAQANKFAAQLNGQINTGIVDPVKKAKFEFKDVARIVQGIIISKAFYGGLNAIRRATDAVWEFSKELEYAKIAYTNLFGSSELALEFINVLKDFAAVTPFTFTEAEAAAKRLLAYGIEYKNVMYVMQGALAASTMQGNPQVIESVSRALGQIYTKGRLMNEEMRQLAEAGIPAYEILADKLGLTNEQLRNLGKNAIPANLAINALVDGINERFGGVLDASSQTITGIVSNIVDNATMLFSGMFEPLTRRIKEVFADIGKLLFELRGAFETGGLGAVFERLVPPELQRTLRTLIANLMNLWSVIKFNLAGIWDLFKQVILAVVNALNILLPIINVVAGAISALTGAIQRNKAVMNTLIGLILAAATAWAIYKVQALLAAATTAVIKGITAALKGLSAMLTFIAAHPIWGLFAIGLALLIGLSGATNKVSEAFKNLFRNFSKFGGVDPDKILLPEAKDRAADLDKFNEKLGQTGKGMDDLTNKTDKAAKAAKGLLSFDEVFKLNEPKDGVDETDFDNFELPDFSGLGGTLMPDMPDFTSFAADFVGNLTEALGGQEKLLGAGIGALLGAAIGGILGGPIGAKVGAILGAFAGWFWNDLAKALNLTDVGTITLPITTGIGAAIGALIGGPPGALLGAGIGALVGWLVDSIARGIQQGDWSKIGLPLGIGLGAGIGFIVGGPAGAAIGAAIGALVGWIVNLLVKNWEGILGWFKTTGDSIGKFFIDVQKKAAVGVKAVGDKFTSIKDTLKADWSTLASGVGGFFSTVGTKFTEGTRDVKIWASDFFTAAAEGTQKFFEPATRVFGEIVAAARQVGSDIFEAINTVWSDLTLGFNTFGSDIVNGLQTVWLYLNTGIQTALTDLSNAFSERFERIKSIVGPAMQSVFDDVSQKLAPIAIIAQEACKGVYDAAAQWFSETSTKVSETVEIMVAQVGHGFKTIYENIRDNVVESFNAAQSYFSQLYDTVATNVQNALARVQDTFNVMYVIISNRVQESYNRVKENFTNAYALVNEKVTAMLATAKEKFDAIYFNVRTNVVNAYESVKTNFSSMYDRMKTSISDMYESVRKGIGNIYQAFKDWISDMWSGIFNKLFGWIDRAIDALDELFNKQDKANRNTSSYEFDGSSLRGHANGGIFNREHIARFSEGNKAEAIIPLENAGAMQPFVNAVADGITASLMPLLAAMTPSSGDNLQPLYVGTLIADDRSLKELGRRMQVMQIQDSTRRGQDG